VRRERTRLLTAFDAHLVSTPPRGRAQRWLRLPAVAASLSLVALVTVLLWKGQPQTPANAVAPSAKAPEAVSIRADSSARWSRRLEKLVETVVLESGALSIRVDHTGSQRRLLVILPDGELEDIGTTFSVSAHAGHTTRVTVQDGSVVLRLHGRPPLVLAAGDSWSPAPAPAEPLATQPSSASSPVARPPSATSAPRRAPLAPDASAQFSAALSAFNAGNNAHAAALFVAFLSQYPADARSEDAAYLRVLALQRAGTTSAMRQAVADYLAHYPRGFRRTEIEPLSR
jgi:hypothetical protein